MYKNLEEEKNYLSQTLERFQEIINYTEKKIKVLPNLYKDNPVLLESLLLQHNHRLKMLKRTEKKPYFARIDFQNQEDQKIAECYIGKVGVQDDDNQLVTVDWRAPIASLYYDSNIGMTKYDAPDGIITGNLLLKRQYEIADGILLNFQDVDTVSNDEILKPYLNASADHIVLKILLLLFNQNKMKLLELGCKII